MLRIVIPGEEHFDRETREVYTVGDVVVDLEYSLVALSKWEQKYKKPFLHEKELTAEEQLYFIECMVVTPEISPETLYRLSVENLNDIKEYTEDKATATWFSDTGTSPKSREIMTSELIYFWMFSAGIDIAAENWHLNRLFTVIKIFGLKNAKPEKMSRSELAKRNREENARRKALYNTSG